MSTFRSKYTVFGIFPQLQESDHDEICYDKSFYELADHLYSRHLRIELSQLTCDI